MPPIENESGKNDFKSRIQQLIDSNQVMVFSKSYCPYCVTVRPCFCCLSCVGSSGTFNSCEYGLGLIADFIPAVTDTVTPLTISYTSPTDMTHDHFYLSFELRINFWKDRDKKHSSRKNAKVISDVITSLRYLCALLNESNKIYLCACVFVSFLSVIHDRCFHVGVLLGQRLVQRAAGGV